MYKFFLIFLFLILQQTISISKTTEKKNFNQRYLSSYISAILTQNNNNSEGALKYFNQSKSLLSGHQDFLKNYTFVLVENNQINKAIKEIRNSKNLKSKDFFEAGILLVTDSIYNNDFTSAQKYLEDLKDLKSNQTFEKIIYETLDSYVYLFLKNKKKKTVTDYGKLSNITDAFQSCYLNDNNAEYYFSSLFNTNDNDYSRYLFFYFEYLYNQNDFQKIQNISKSINLFDTNLLIAQSKQWIENENYFKFSQFFSCKKPKDLISEFYFLISNLYSSQDDFLMSNFYIKISNFLNNKFHFNLSLLADNYFRIGDYDEASEILHKISNEHQVYKWYKIKKNAQILSLKKSELAAIKFIERNFSKLKNPNEKVFFDLGNIYKNFKQYGNSINYYNKVLSLIEKNTPEYADTLYRRGSSYERLGDYENSDLDLLSSLDIVPNDPYVLNYIGYSWLERNYKVDEAVEMLKSAYNQKKDDPYITDSLGWAYFALGDYNNAENFLNKALQTRPSDVVIIDHYADTLWMLDRKLQAKYYWKYILNSEDTQDINKVLIKKKLIFGLNN